jgi:D-erythro-7,8-dihydroneopterin triphosphate epimerase
MPVGHVFVLRVRLNKRQRSITITSKEEIIVSTKSATINIQNLRLRTYIGFNPDEMQKQQDVVINIRIRYQLNTVVLQDRVEGALNYKTVTKKVIRHVEQGRFLLLEKLVADILSISSEHPSVMESTVTADKPHALRFADSVSLTMDYTTDAATNIHYLEKAS